MQIPLRSLRKSLRSLHNPPHPYHHFPSSPDEPAIKNIRWESESQDKPLHPGLYDPPPPSPKGSTSCLPGTPRHGPLIDLCDDDEEQCDTPLWDKNPARAVARLCGEMTTTEQELYDAIVITAEQNYGSAAIVTSQEAALGRIPARRGICVVGGYEEELEEGLFAWNVEMDEALLAPGVDENCSVSISGSGSGAEEGDDRWSTKAVSGSTAGSGLEESRDIVDATREETDPSQGDGGKRTRLGKWLWSQASEEAATGVVPSDELVGLGAEEAAAWARGGKEDEDESEGIDTPSQSSISSPVGKSDAELDDVLEMMQTAEEGRATRMGEAQALRYYGDGAGDEAEYIVLDHPDLEFFDRIEALEAASLSEWCI